MKALSALAPLSALVLVGSAGLAAPTLPSMPTANAATPACQIAYTVINQWPTGFQASIDITNNEATLNGWTLGFRFPGNQQVVNGWNGVYSQTSTQVSVGDAGWNAVLNGGQTINIGFVGSYSGTNDPPTAFTLNGVSCNGAPQTPNVTLTSPANNTVLTAPATIQLAATVVEPGGTISRVDFLNGGTLLGSDTTSPYTFALANAAAGSYSFLARAVDAAGATGDSLTSTVLVRPAGTSPGAPVVHVSGNHLVDQSGNTVMLRGVNRSGTEYQCVHGFGIFDGPSDDASIAAMATWNVNAVRVPLNEDCWLGLPNVMPQFAGVNYQNAIKAYVSLLHQHGMDAIIDLHWSDGSYTGNSGSCANATADCQKPMPDAEHAVDFWRSVASTFGGDDAVVFDLFNEPFPDRATTDLTAAWTCWRDGGTCAGISFPVAGMQTLVNTVRAAGATNVILLGGLAFSNDERQWLAFEPTDPAGNLGASWHSYNFNICIDLNCWTNQIAPVSAQVPLIAGEIGENDCAHGYIDGLMNFLDQHSAGYLGWAWNANFDCNSGPALISSYDGTPTNFGIGLRTHLLGLG
ncbi:MAG TPA: cellulase family glycosylhydrolase [Mycobacteriales bacterium]|nr:cellulase family glycosylhydrolase [Mycobacteriales bacterium]